MKMGKETPENVGVNGNARGRKSKIKSASNGTKTASQSNPELNNSLNAFQVLMNSHKKVIGSNSPGKEAADEPEGLNLDKETKSKRKLFLKEWADRKVGKKPLLEAEREKTVKNILKKRRTKFTEMLLNKCPKKPAGEDSNDAIDGKNEPIVKRRRRSKKMTVIDSDSDSSNGENKKLRIQDESLIDNDAFLSKLSPSIRKQENMMSYFKKIPAVHAAETNDDTICKISPSLFRRRSRKDKNIVKTKPNGEINGHGSGIDSDVDIISISLPEKENINGKTSQIVSPIKIVNIGSPDIKCLKSPKILIDPNATVKCSTKLAPLFMKKSSSDSNLPIAPPKKSSSFESFKRIEKCDDPEPTDVFLDVMNIQQIPAETDDDYHSWNLPKIEPKWIADNSDIDDVCLSDKYDYAILDRLNRPSIEQLLRPYDCPDHKQTIKRLKELYPNFPINKTYKRLKGKNISLSNSDIVDDSLWTDKYKATCSDDIIGNFNSVSILKKWLSSWNEFSTELLSKIKNRSNKDDSSSSEFIDSDSDYGSMLPSNVRIVTGPKGCGKTSAVYGIAKELNMNILEVNASSRRTGKKILRELQEATQSHKVQTKKALPENFFKSAGSKSKKTEKKASESKDVNKISIMLIEDADIVFDEDDGFTTALHHIISISKRPVIITAANLQCHHLRKIINESNVIKFYPLSGRIVGPWLDLMMIVECGRFIPELSSNLIDYYRGDMRKTIFQLQFWLPSKIEPIKSENELQNYTIEIMKLITNFPDVYNDCGFISDYKTNLAQSNDEISLKNMCELTDMFSIMNVMRSVEDTNKQTIDYWQNELKDSLSVDEDYTEYNRHSEFLKSWSNHVLNRYDLPGKQDIFTKKIDEIRWNKQHHSVYSTILDAVPASSQLDRRSLSLDYASTFRSICRTEKSRSELQLKRHNRFYHYFRSLNIDVDDAWMNTVCDIFK